MRHDPLLLMPPPPPPHVAQWSKALPYIYCHCERVSSDSPSFAHTSPLDHVESLTNKSNMADSTPKSYHTDPTLYLYTSLTSGSSHIISATSRMQTILKANKIDFQALDVATVEKARMLWGRRAGKRKLPGLVRFGMIVGVCLEHTPRIVWSQWSTEMFTGLGGS